MATTTASAEELIANRARGTPGFRWGAVFAGAFVALGIWILLYSLGLAIGLSSINPANPASARGVGIGTGIWSLVTPLVALFLGGLVAARVAGPADRLTGALHGLVLWGLTTVVGLVLVGMLISTLVSRLTGAVGQAAQAAPQAGAALGISGQDLLGPVNQRLQAAGRPTVTAEQLQQTVQQFSQQAVAQGRFDTELFAGVLAQNTRLSQQDAREVAAQFQQQITGAGQGLQAGALRAAEASGPALWGVFFALLLGLISAVLGATAGVSRRQRAAVAYPAEAHARG